MLYSFPLRLGVTGTGDTGWQQVTGLLRQHVTVTLYCGSCEKPIYGLHNLHETLRIGGIKIPIRLLRRRALALHDKIVARALRRLHREIDVVHCWPSGSRETLKVSRELGIKSVLERPNTHTRYAFEVVRQEYQKLGMKMIRITPSDCRLKRKSLTWQIGFCAHPNSLQKHF